LAKQNYRHMKKQKEAARLARQVEKQQRRQTRPIDETGATEGGDPGVPDAAQATNDGIAKV
jgi:hypothetical protein